MVDLLVYGFLLAAFLLFNYVSAQAAKRRRAQQRREDEAMMLEVPAPGPVVLQGDPFGTVWGRTPQPARGAQGMDAAWGRAPEAVTLERVAGERAAPEALASEPWAQEPPASEIAPGFQEEANRSGLPDCAAAGSALQPPRRAHRPHPPPHRLRRRQDLRAAVVAMTVLGPCRALQPWAMEEGAPSGPAGAGPAAR